MYHRFIKVTAIQSALSKLYAYRLRIGTIAISHAVLATVDFFFDNLLYPAMLVWHGKLVGGVIMTLLSCVICFCLVTFYVWSKKDWLGIDVVEAVKERGEVWIKRFYSTKGHWCLLIKAIAYLPSRIFLLVMWLLKKNDIAAFLALSVYQDAFKTTIFLRHGRTDGLASRDWLIFVASIIVSNVYWTLRWSVIIEIVKTIF